MIYILQRRHLSPQKIKLIQFSVQILKVTLIFHGNTLHEIMDFGKFRIRRYLLTVEL